ncbi:hypothetical protein F0562_028739 [Nyssa sinensis]|uniref:RING-type domain-containing protein n=1 Tax=Nyssa sinensis TaxID=561372 RepID=A0A5J5B544_9ASTE|nr:hypothetical protein F0562_028739 [Nyssa sinensis]
MTTASELFYTRRSRFGRNTVELGFDSSLDRNFHHSHGNRRQHSHTRRDRHDLDDCDPLRRSAYLRHTSHRPSYPEREPVRLDQASSQSASGNIVSSDNFSSIHNRLRSNGNDRLPGAVLLARERLLERLRGVSLSGNRQNNRASSVINQDDVTFRNDFRLVDAGDWEAEISREWQAGGPPFIDPIIQTEQLAVPEASSKRPPGLTKEALDCLHLEVFRNIEDNDEGTISRASRECSICLESFLEGDELIRLPCDHRFHSCCLDPWVRSCGDCPYCRAGIVVTSYRDIKIT